MSEPGQRLLRSRREKLESLRQRGIDPFPHRFRRTASAYDAVTLFEEHERRDEPGADAPLVSVAGRVTSLRSMGKVTFIDVTDGSGKIQVMLRSNVLHETYDLVRELDLGDIVGAEGPLMKTRTGEITVEARSYTVLSKSLRPLPEKWHGLKDIEQRYRQRYLDLIANSDVKRPFLQRSRIINEIRSFLNDRGFIEVDTPILVPVAAGAMARPFITHHNALDETLYLRIATELYLKRLIVGGLDKVYELGRVFRNEGVDQDHNPEFTLLESYEAYGDYMTVLSMVEDMVSSVAQEVIGTTKLDYAGHSIDLSPPWERLSLKEELSHRTGIDIDAYPDATSIAKRVRDLGLEMGESETRGRIIDKLVSSFIEPHLIQPTFLLDYPEEMSPLAKAKVNSPGYVERFEGFVAGMEIANSYTELNDPDIQRDRFMAQEELRRVNNDEEVERLDEDFLLALEYGMPPTGGLGMGIDRLVMVLTGQTSIRDVLLFPQMRSKD